MKWCLSVAALGLSALPPQSLPFSSDADFEREFLEAHNAYRQDHGAPPLMLSRELCVSAQSWADHLLAIRMLKHTPESDKGENIFSMQSSRPMKISGKQPVENWYDEIKDYNFTRPGFTPNTGHFTQVVWKDTKELGVGIATDGTTIFVVGQYLPPGNVQSYFERNVLPPGGKVSRGDSELPTPTTKDTTSPTGSTRLSANTSDFQKEALEAHNAWRQQHGAPPLSLDLGLCWEAQKWAEHLVQLDMLQHSDTDLGQNIFSIWSSENIPLSGKYAVELCYREIKDYDFSKPGYQTSTDAPQPLDPTTLPSTQSMQALNRVGARTHLWGTPESTGKNMEVLPPLSPALTVPVYRPTHDIQQLWGILRSLRKFHRAI